MPPTLRLTAHSNEFKMMMKQLRLALIALSPALAVARVAFLSLFLSASAMAANLELVVDASADGPAKFAAEEIRREALAHGMTLGKDLQATRLSLRVEQDGKAAAQSYRISPIARRAQ